MSVYQDSFTVQTGHRGTRLITNEVLSIVERAGINTGLCHVFCHHTSASLILNENADPAVHRDLEAFMSRLVPDGDLLYEHIDEGPDDMPAHVRMTLTQTGLSIPLSNGYLGLGTWQGIYLWEHRTMSHLRKITVTVQGE